MSVTPPAPPGPGDVLAAAGVLDGVAHRTPVLTSVTLDVMTGATVLLKAEHLQRAGAFKFRGAYNALSRLGPDAGQRGVVAYSSGNHAQALALAGRLLDIPVVVVMPHDAPAAKRAATESYGARVVGYDRHTEDRMALARQIAERTGADIVPPFDHPDVIAGQGTAVLELLADSGPLDVLLVPLGGGGLFAGSLLAVAAGEVECRCYGVEPAAGDDFARSLAVGHPVSIEVPRTVADCLATTRPGDFTFPIVAARAAGTLTVTDEQLLTAVRFCLDRLHQVVEPGGAAGLAALLAGLVPDIAGRRVGIVLSGGNVGASRLAELLR